MQVENFSTILILIQSHVAEKDEMFASAVAFASCKMLTEGKHESTTLLRSCKSEPVELQRNCGGDCVGPLVLCAFAVGLLVLWEGRVALAQKAAHVLMPQLTGTWESMFAVLLIHVFTMDKLA